MMAHHRIGQDRHAEDRGGFVNAVLYLLPTVLEGAAGQPILTTKEARRTQRETQWKVPGEPGGKRMERA